MITYLDVYDEEWAKLSVADRNRLGEWIHEVVGRRMFVRGVELVAEGAIRVEIYVDEAGIPAEGVSDIFIDRPTGIVATKWFEYSAAEPPPVWPGMG